MAIGQRAAVFISSTCFDLAQVRTDLSSFIGGLGMTPVLSEHNAFPIDPNLDVVSNCLGRVKENADIFVLVIGGRYGSCTDTGDSITNLEYIEAKNKGIPRYVFVDKKISTMLPLWEANPSADFSSVVDSTKLFEFVKTLRDPRENWVFPFESAQDIIEILRIQFAHLLKDALDMRYRVRGADIAPHLRDLSAAALAIIVQKPRAWEYKLFCQVLSDEIERCGNIKRDLQYGISLGPVALLDDIDSFSRLVRERLTELPSFVRAAANIANVALPKAFGEPGQPGDVSNIIYAAERLGLVYRGLLEWTLQFANLTPHEKWGKALAILSRSSELILTELEQYPVSFVRQLEAALARRDETGEMQTLQMILKLDIPDSVATDLESELRRLTGHRLE